MTTCRKCYIHPPAIERYMAGQHRLRVPARIEIVGLQREEIAVLRHIARPFSAPPRVPVAVRPKRKTAKL